MDEGGEQRVGDQRAALGREGGADGSSFRAREVSTALCVL